MCNYYYFLALFIYCVSAIDDDQKYIDLLPFDEKQQLLDRVARRLLTEVIPEGEHKESSISITDEDLEKHGDLVRKVLKEETANLRSSKRSNSNPEKDETQPNEKTKNDDRESGHIDLTLRDGKRIKRRQSEVLDKSSEGFNIPVKAVYDAENKRLKDKTNSVSYKSVETSDSRDIQVRGAIQKRRKQLVDIADTGTEINDFEPDDETTENLNKINVNQSITSTAQTATTDKTDNGTNIEGVTASIYETQESYDQISVETSDNDREEHSKTRNNTVAPTTISSTTTKPTTVKLKNKAQDKSESVQKQFLRVELEREDNKRVTDADAILVENDTFNGSVNKVTTEFPLSFTEIPVTETHFADINTTEITVTESTTVTNITEVEAIRNSNKDFVDDVYTTETFPSSHSELENEYSTTLKDNSSVTADRDNVNSNTSLNKTNDFNVAINKSSDFKDKYKDKRTEVDTTEKYIENRTQDALKVNDDIKNKNFSDEVTAADEYNVTTTTTNGQFTSNPVLTSTEAPKINIIEKNTKENVSKNTSALIKNDTASDLEILNELVKALRSGVKSEVNGNKQENIEDDDYLGRSFKKSRTIHPKKKAYLVFEIPADRAPFVKTYEAKNNILSENQPQYAPVYDYSPKNAYFNAHNLLGPNSDSSSEYHNKKTKSNQQNDDGEDSSIELLRKFKFAKKKTIYKTNTQIKNSYKLRMPKVVSKPKFTEIYFNPNDYLDMDYYFGRRDSKPKVIKEDKPTELPNVGDEGHPYNLLMKNDVKDHINGVRLMLYEQKLFGNVPEYSTPKTHRFRTDVSENERKLVVLINGDHKPVLRTTDDFDSFEDCDDQNAEVNIITESEEKQSEVYADNRDKEKEIENETDVNNVTVNTTEQAISIEISDQSDRKKNGKKKKEVDVNKGGTIKEILSVVDEKDVFPKLKTLLDLKVPLGRNKVDADEDAEELEPYVNAIRNMIRSNDEALRQYDWLGTTVDIRSATTKILATINNLKVGMKLHPYDYQLLNYIKYLHTMATMNVEKESSKDGEARESRQRSRLPRKKHLKTKVRKFLKDKGLINRVWLYIRGRMIGLEEDTERQRVVELEEPVEEIADALYDLHNAVKHISKITYFQKQRWYQNLKELYLKDLTKKQLLEVLLHISTARLISLIEESSKLGVAEDYNRYIETHEKEVERSKEEFIFVLKVLKQIKNIL